MCVLRTCIKGACNPMTMSELVNFCTLVSDMNHCNSDFVFTHQNSGLSRSELGFTHVVAVGSIDSKNPLCCGTCMNS